MPYKDIEKRRECCRENHIKHREAILKRKKENYNKDEKQQYYQDNKENILTKTNKYKKNNKEKIRKYNRDNKEKINIQQNNYVKKRYKNDPIFRLNHNMSNNIRKSLKKHNLSKNKKSWISLTGYSVQELKEHLERLFQPGMTWENHGKWHIDHIIPISFFKYSSTKDAEFKYCWSLNNLQPLWAKDNLNKSNNIIFYD